MIKKTLLIITAVAFTTFSFSQQISRHVVASGGVYATSSGYSLSSTIGEPMVATFTSASNVLTQGFQQSFPPLTCDVPTNLQLETAFDTRSWVQWDEMSSVSDSASFYKVVYRAVGDTTWLIKQKPYGGNQTPTVRVRLQFLTASTLYEMKIKAGYNSGCISDFSPISYFTTADECPNVSNFSVSSPKSTKAVFSWDTTSSYSFVRIKFRVDTQNAAWMSAGGFGVSYPLLSKSKNGLTPGESYRGQARTWCDPNGGPYRSLLWTPLIFWTQPSSIRVEGGTSINNLDVYPNPSRDIFNVEFNSENKQKIEVRILNLEGEIVFTENLEEFEGEYIHSFNLGEYSKGVYLLELDTDNGLISKKLILQ